MSNGASPFFFWALTSATALAMTVKVFRPRKSNFTRPASSTSSLANWVTISPFCPRKHGTYSQSGFSEMTTPAACMPAWRFRPSSALAMSRSSRYLGSLS